MSYRNICVCMIINMRFGSVNIVSKSLLTESSQLQTEKLFVNYDLFKMTERGYESFRRQFVPPNTSNMYLRINMQ